MIEFVQAIPFTYAALFPVLNPLGSAVIFLTLTMGLPERDLHKLSRKVAFNTFLLLIIVLFGGSWFLRIFGITVPAVQIGGGLVVAYIGWTLLNRPASSTGYGATPPKNEAEASDMAFFPLTMPITAGPGCIAVTLTIGAHEVKSTSLSHTFFNQLGATVGILLAAMTVFLCYRYAFRLTRSLGTAGTQVITRLSAFINLCIGIEIIINGINGLMS